MRLWLALYILGKLAVIWGPFPDAVTFPQCQDLALDQKLDAMESKTVAGVSANDMEYRCIWRDDQPDVGEAMRK